MKGVTNLVLISSLLLVLLLICLAALSGTSESSATAIKFFSFTVLISGLAAFGYRRIEKRVGQGDFLSRPVSAMTGKVVKNIVVILWLILVAVIIFTMAKAASSKIFYLMSLTALILAMISGSVIKKRFSSDSLLPYGVSFLGALLLLLTIFVCMSKY